MERCEFCGHLTTMVWVHGHYQCSNCRQITIPCCNGETAARVTPDVERPQARERPAPASR